MGKKLKITISLLCFILMTGCGTKEDSADMPLSDNGKIVGIMRASAWDSCRGEKRFHIIQKKQENSSATRRGFIWDLNSLQIY